MKNIFGAHYNLNTFILLTICILTKYIHENKIEIMRKRKVQNFDHVKRFKQSGTKRVCTCRVQNDVLEAT